jgi:cytochrome c
MSIPAAVLMFLSTGTVKADEALVKESGCLECHSAAEDAIAPSFNDMAERYRADANARDALIESVKNGGKGNWTDATGGVPMPPYSPRLTDAEIERLVDWMLRL